MNEGGPAWNFDSSELIRDLDIVSAFPVGANVFFRLSAEVFEDSEAPFLQVVATNKDYVLEHYLPLAAGDHLPGKAYFVKLPILTSLAKMYPDFHFEFGPKGELFFQSSEARFELRTVQVEGLEVPQFDYESAKKPLPIPRNALTSARRLLDYATKIVDNKVTWNGPRLGGSFLSIAFTFRLGKPESVEKLASPVFFRKFDVGILAAMSSVHTRLDYAVDDTRFYLHFERGCLSFPLIKKAPPQLTKNPKEAEPYAEVSFDTSSLSKVLAFARTMQVQGNVVFVPEESKIFAKVDSSSRFLVGSGKAPSHGFSLRAEELKKILGVLPEGGGKTLPCHVYENRTEFNVSEGDDSYTYVILGTTKQVTISSVEVIDRLNVKKD